MSEARCSACGSELVSGTGFCRQCGEPVTQDSEQPTAILNQVPDGTTQRLDPRPTNPYREASPSAADGLSEELAAATAPPGARPQKLLFIGIVVLAVIGFASIVGVVRSVLQNRSEGQNSAQVSRALIYPGSRIVLDLGQDSGGSVLQLATSDPLDKVQTWYISNLKPDKILQATMGAVILRKDRVTATLVTENNNTTIVIKQARR